MSNAPLENSTCPVGKSSIRPLKTAPPALGGAVTDVSVDGAGSYSKKKVGGQYPWSTAGQPPAGPTAHSMRPLGTNAAGASLAINCCPPCTGNFGPSAHVPG